MNPRTRRLRKFRRRFKHIDNYTNGDRCWECGRKFENCLLALEVKRECEEIVARMTDEQIASFRASVQCT